MWSVCACDRKTPDKREKDCPQCGLTVKTIKEPTGRAGPRVAARTRLLKTFGGEARYAIPMIRKVLGKAADAIVKSIEEATTTRKMISLEEVKAPR